jgi:uncharacterized membrane protein YbhN (UPF0104 family)
MMRQIDSESIPPTGRPPYLGFLSLGMSGLLVAGGAFVMYRWISGPEILRLLRRLDWHWLIPALFFYWLQFPIAAIRMNRVIYWLMRRGSRPPPSFKLILKLTLSASFVSVATPISLMADAAKIGALKYFGHMSATHAIRCTLFDRVIAAQWMSLFALATLPAQWWLNVPANSIGVQFLVSAGFIAGIGILLFLPNMLGIFRHKMIAKIARIFTDYEMMFPPRRLLIQMLITLSNLVLVFISFYCLLRALGLNANLILIACFIPFLQLINGLPFLYMGWGGREIAMAATVGTVSGLSLNEALVVSATWGMTLIMASAVNGVSLLGDWASHRYPKRDIA